MLEVALPPGAAVETGTWGIQLKQGDKSEALERARNQDRPDGYLVPVDALDAPLRPCATCYVFRKKAVTACRRPHPPGRSGPLRRR
ncbi:MAG TPA: hypothetical protein VGP06_14460 [Janthinobacterium sp.]|nr:hypothetical protein [Janthinobacterium sp.]